MVFRKIATGLQNLNQSLHHYPNVSIDEAITGVLRAAARLKYTVLNSDRDSGTISFQTNAKEKRWDGVISVMILSEPTGVEILISSRTDKGGIYNPFGIAATSSEGAKAIKSAQLLGSIKMEMDSLGKTSKDNSSESVNQTKSGLKICPFCAEEVKTAAIKCKHCGSDL